MCARRLDEEGSGLLHAAVADADTVTRRERKIVRVTGSECWWWTGAISGKGHGRFWFAPGRVIIARRFGFAQVHGVAALAATEVLGHRCDNPLCQRVHPEARAVERGNCGTWRARIRSWSPPTCCD